VLLVDIGNTRIKWAWVRNQRLSRQRAAVHAGWQSQDFEREILGGVKKVDRIVVVSVASEAVNQSFTEAAQRAAHKVPEFVASARTASGITTRYREPWRLGADRFVAVVAAHSLAGKRGACVIDAGTAMTIDVVDGKGIHHGGAIVPGPDLMVSSLLKNTNGIQQRAQGGASGRGLFARETRAAVEQGASHAAAAIVDRAVDEAKIVMRASPLVILTGGAAKRIHPLIRSRHVSVPDLVLRGLAVIVNLNVR
jgi:type III pantothenate kinase